MAYRKSAPIPSDEGEYPILPRPGHQMRKTLSLLAIMLAVGVSHAHADTYTKQGLVEPKLHLAGHRKVPTVALTFDACMGATDPRILDELVTQRIPATIFVTARWLKHNAATFAILNAHPELFQIENHGENHIPAVDVPIKIYGIAAAGSPDAVAREINGGTNAILAAGAPKPQWYRDATAVYSPAAISQIRALGYRVAGFSVNGDGGSLLGVEATVRSFTSAKDGDVIIAHINQPTHQAGEGVVKGIEALRAKGYQFVRLGDQPMDDEKAVKIGG